MLNFLLTFGLLGLICVPFIIMFLVYSEDLSHKLVGAIVILLVWLILGGAITLHTMSRADSWNDGYCDCGTHWELRGAAKNRTGTETKYYACPNCYAEIEQ